MSRFRGRPNDVERSIESLADSGMWTEEDIRLAYEWAGDPRQIARALLQSARRQNADLPQHPLSRSSAARGSTTNQPQPTTRDVCLVLVTPVLGTLEELELALTDREGLSRRLSAARAYRICTEPELQRAREKWAASPSERDPGGNGSATEMVDVFTVGLKLTDDELTVEPAASRRRSLLAEALAQHAPLHLGRVAAVDESLLALDPRNW